MSKPYHYSAKHARAAYDKSQAEAKRFAAVRAARKESEKRISALLDEYGFVEAMHRIVTDGTEQFDRNDHLGILADIEQEVARVKARYSSEYDPKSARAKFIEQRLVYEAEMRVKHMWPRRPAKEWCGAFNDARAAARAEARKQWRERVAATGFKAAQAWYRQRRPVEFVADLWGEPEPVKPTRQQKIAAIAADERGDPNTRAIAQAKLQPK